MRAKKLILAPSLFLSLVALALTSGCEDKKSTTAAPSATVATAAPSATTSASAAPSAAPSAMVGKNEKMAHCPGAVDGAKTTIKDVEGGVELTIVATDAAKTADIRARAKTLADAAANPEVQAKHTGGGGGQGIYGRCAVIVRGTTLTLADVDGGTKITVKPRDPKELDWLRDETRDREEAMGEQLQGIDAGAGAKKMEHCPSAVDGVTTALKDTKDGFVITVTGKTPDQQKEIRARAKHVIDVTHADAGAVAHTGEGTGGHNLGRCPEVIKDTTVTAKDVANGSELTVKAKSAGDVTKVQKEGHQRAERFVAAPATSGSAATAPSGSAPAAAPSSSAKPK